MAAGSPAAASRRTQLPSRLRWARLCSRPGTAPSCAAQPGMHCCDPWLGSWCRTPGHQQQPNAHVTSSPSPPGVSNWHHTAVQGTGGWAHLGGGLLAVAQVPSVSLLQSHCSLQDKDQHMHGALPELVCCALLWALATHTPLQSSQVCSGRLQSDQGHATPVQAWCCEWPRKHAAVSACWDRALTCEASSDSSCATRRCSVATRSTCAGGGQPQGGLIATCED